MRKLIVSTAISVDGYFEGPGKDVMALPLDEGFEAYNLERLRSAGTMVVGRTTFEGLVGYWPPLADDPDARPALREISRRNGAIEKLVVSDSLTKDQTVPWADSTHIVKRADAPNQVAELKRQQGKQIVVFGSHLVWNDLLTHGLVDELHLLVGPAFLGSGTPAFEGKSPVPLRLLESRALPNSQLVLLRYDARPDAVSLPRSTGR